jgi:hypothetical protein
MGAGDLFRSWPVYRQLPGPDRTGRGAAARSPHTDRLRSRVAAADEVVRSVCPYWAGSFTNTQRLLQWRRKGGRPARRRAQLPVVHLPPGPQDPGRSLV